MSCARFLGLFARRAQVNVAVSGAGLAIAGGVAAVAPFMTISRTVVGAAVQACTRGLRAVSEHKRGRVLPARQVAPRATCRLHVRCLRPALRVRLRACLWPARARAPRLIASAH